MDCDKRAQKLNVNRPTVVCQSLPAQSALVVEHDLHWIPPLQARTNTITCIHARTYTVCVYRMIVLTFTQNWRNAHVMLLNVLRLGGNLLVSSLDTLGSYRFVLVLTRLDWLRFSVVKKRVPKQTILGIKSFFLRNERNVNNTSRVRLDSTSGL